MIEIDHVRSEAENLNPSAIHVSESVGPLSS